MTQRATHARSPLAGRLARGADFWLRERDIEARPFGVGRDDFCKDGRPPFSKKYGGADGVLFDDILKWHQRDMERAAQKADPNQPAKAKPPPRPRSGPPPKARPAPVAFRTQEMIALDGVPRLRARRFCPASARVRTSPRATRHYPQPRLVFSLESPRAPLQVGSLDRSGTPPPRPPPRRTASRQSEGSEL